MPPPMTATFGPRSCVRCCQMRLTRSSPSLSGTTALTSERLSFHVARTVMTVAAEMNSSPRTHRGRNCNVAVPTQSGNAYET